MTVRLAIIDRDGVINVDPEDYISNEREWQAIPGSLEAIGRLNRAGYRVVVITNQAGLAKGKLNIDDLNAIHDKMRAHLAQYGGMVDAILFCPHGPDENCACRKPRPGLFLDLAERMRISLADVPAIGDKPSDITAARAAGATAMLVRTGYGRAAEAAGEVPADVPVFDDLKAAVDAILAGH